MTLVELQVKERELRYEMFDLKLKARAGQIAKPSRIRDLRRDIARVLTIVNKKAITQNVVAQPVVAAAAKQKTSSKEKAVSK